jgi:hypothetical protein
VIIPLQVQLDLSCCWKLQEILKMFDKILGRYQSLPEDEEDLEQLLPKDDSKVHVEPPRDTTAWISELSNKRYSFSAGFLVTGAAALFLLFTVFSSTGGPNEALLGHHGGIHECQRKCYDPCGNHNVIIPFSCFFLSLGALFNSLFCSGEW